MLCNGNSIREAGNGVLWDKTLPNPAGASAGDSVGRRGVAAKARDKSQCRGPTKLVRRAFVSFAVSR